MFLMKSMLIESWQENKHVDSAPSLPERHHQFNKKVTTLKKEKVGERMMGP